MNDLERQSAFESLDKTERHFEHMMRKFHTDVAAHDDERSAPIATVDSIGVTRAAGQLVWLSPTRHRLQAGSYNWIGFGASRRRGSSFTV
ncbi:MAG: hypothetical protein HY736_14830 [Verrucomicrobia bacterium]|nr:hypothetical protein [Verrucomicrobiota bacterium]